MKPTRSMVVLVSVVVLATAGFCGDWPQFRYDAGRSAASPESLPAEMHLQWVRELPTPLPAFPGEVRLRYDGSYEPVVAGGTVFVPSMVTESVTALDAATGAERWRVFAEGPVRFAPVAWQGKVYFVSDDGHLYCVRGDTGALVWTHRGLPAGRDDRKLLGDGRLVSLFPARGGPVVAKGVVYYGAGLWSAEGVFMHALDAASGKVVWSNVDSHRVAKANMDHGVGYFAGITPQGYLAMVGGKLVVPCGAQLPALMDPATGKLHPYTMGWGGRVGLAKGTWFVAGVGNYLVHGGDLYDISQPNQERLPKTKKGARDFKPMLYLGGLTRLQIDRSNQKFLRAFREPVLTAEAMYCQDKGIAAWDLTAATVEERARTPVPEHRKNDTYPDKTRGTFRELWRLPRKSKVHIRAGQRLYCGAAGLIEAIDLPEEGQTPQVTWRAKVQGTPQRLLAADGKLFAVTREGRIYAFGGTQRAQPVVHARPTAPAPVADVWTQRAAGTLERTGVKAGYALMLGIGSGRMATELVRQSGCNVIAIEPDAAKVAELRETLHQAGLYGTRVTLRVGHPATYPLPPYLASLVVSEDAGLLGAMPERRVAETVVHCLRPYGGAACLWFPAEKREGIVRAVNALKVAGVTARLDRSLVVVTRGGALPESGDWSHDGANAANTGASEEAFVKPPLGLLWFSGAARWSRIPRQTDVRVAGGRLFVKAAKLHAVDVFTGRRLWDAPLPRPFGPGADFVTSGGSLYIAGLKSCLVVDPATGKERSSVALPDDVARGLSGVRVSGDVLVGASGTHLLCMDLKSGELSWRVARPRPIGAIALGGGKVFCADRIIIKNRKPQPPHPEARIQAFDLATGKQVWDAPGASEVRYSKPHGLLFAASGVYRGADGTRVRGGATGRITPDRVLAGQHDGFTPYDLSTGEKAADKPLQWNRRGCTSLRASTRLLTTRYMGNAAIVDIETGYITSLWNIRAACSNNLFPANGVLNVPNLSGGCTCNYLPVSQAFVPVSSIIRPAADRP